MQLDNMTEIIIESIGWFGSILILGAYFLNMQHKILATSPFYIWANLVGGFCFVINTYYHHAFPSMTLNIIWVLIAVYSLIKAKKETE
jgi:hypothetical protein